MLADLVWTLAGGGWALAGGNRASACSIRWHQSNHRSFIWIRPTISSRSTLWRSLSSVSWVCAHCCIHCRRCRAFAGASTARSLGIGGRSRRYPIVRTCGAIEGATGYASARCSWPAGPTLGDAVGDLVGNMGRGSRRAALRRVSLALCAAYSISVRSSASDSAINERWNSSSSSLSAIKYLISDSCCATCTILASSGSS
mmetsp:Transcript_148169/g.258974  ORF Transcript_148169/g.258974 Transcript_148169/m.258974 type:complete len:200 (-) Transcript_148169:771-1370(-)